ncbi:MAG TPA: hypothetical protein VGE45_18755 [Chloroflexia bacterium]|jgi:hypothetical protein
MVQTSRQPNTRRNIARETGLALSAPMCRRPGLTTGKGAWLGGKSGGSAAHLTMRKFKAEIQEYLDTTPKERRSRTRPGDYRV